MGCTIFQGISTCSTRDPSWTAVWICPLTLSSIGCTGTSAPSPGAPPPPPSSLTLVSERLLLLYFSHSSLTAAIQHFYPFLNMFLQKCHQYHGWAQLCSVVVWVNCTGTDCDQHGQTLVSPHRGNPSNPPATKILPHKPNTL